MKTGLFVILTLMSFGAFAGCPIEWTFDGTAYCASVNWQVADKKTGGAFVASEDISPYLNKKGATPPQWRYSRAHILFWKKGDPAKTSLFMNNLRVFPYMQMLGGHHHGASYQWQWDAQNQIYVISAMALTQMEGCWTLRVTTASTDQMDSSSLLMEVTDYSNASADEKFTAITLCGLCSSGPPDQGGHGEHHAADH